MNIIVNGGSRGIGKEVVQFLARDINNQILVTGRNKIALSYLSGQNKNIHHMVLDMALIDTQVESVMEHIAKHFTKVDILINMAGLLVMNDFMSSNNNEARMMMETNFFGPASLIRLLQPLMPQGSHIINIASMGGFQGSTKYRGLSYYSASKAAISSLSESLAVEFMESGISVNCLALGAVQTEMFEEAFPGHKAPVEANEIAEYISGFALKGHKFMNGKIIPVAVNNP